MFPKCATIARDTVCLEASVKITPEIRIGKAIITCKGPAFIGRCMGTPQEACSFFVSQKIDVAIPLAFDAEVCAQPDGIVCGEPTTIIGKEGDGDGGCACGE